MKLFQEAGERRNFELSPAVYLDFADDVVRRGFENLFLGLFCNKCLGGKALIIKQPKILHKSLDSRDSAATSLAWCMIESKRLVV